MVRVRDSIARNRAQWAAWAAEYAARAEAAWRGDATWGIWQVPEHEVGLLEDVEGKDVLEVGCGTAYVSKWVADRGGRPVGLDPTEEQLASAARTAEVVGPAIPLVQGAGEELPFPDASFDLVLSEYGAAIWADPYRWIPEAARVLRPGGELRYLGNSVLLMLCVPDLAHEAATNELLRPQFGMHRFEWPDDDSVEFHLSHGDTIALLRACGFEVLRLAELRPAADATKTYPFVTLGWSRRWPCEEAWFARKLAPP